LVPARFSKKREENQWRDALTFRFSLLTLRVAVPIYEYELCQGSCKVCGGRFTLRRPIAAPPLTRCPACKKPVRKVLSTFNSPVKLKPLSVSDAKKAGFTVLKRVNKGEYERQ
jgi:putative FmdB family regulatory protein